MSEVIAFEMSSPDENHQFHLMETVNALAPCMGAHSLYECPSEATLGSVLIDLGNNEWLKAITRCNFHF